MGGMSEKSSSSGKTSVVSTSAREANTSTSLKSSVAGKTQHLRSKTVPKLSVLRLPVVLEKTKTGMVVEETLAAKQQVEAAVNSLRPKLGDSWKAVASGMMRALN